MNRTVSPELLDSLPADSAAARHSRRDLQWFNRLLGNDGWWRRTLPQYQSIGRGLEIGAGDGQLALRFDLDALDLQSSPERWPHHRKWHTSDVGLFAHWHDYPLVVSNLFLHHLQTEQLTQLGRIWNDTAQTLICCEPWRVRGFGVGFSLLCAVIRAHRVSRHDGRVSIEAGFRDNELPEALGLDKKIWEWRISHTVRGMYRMVAQRRDLK